MLDEQIAALVAERERAEEELTDSAGAREQATAALYRLRSGGERIVLRRESAAALTASLRTELEAARTHDPSASVELEAVARDAAATAQAAAAEQRAAAGRGRRALGARRRRRAERPGAARVGARRGARRAAPQTESLLTGGGRDALLALRGAVQTARRQARVGRTSARRAPARARRRAPRRRAARRRPSSAAPPTRPTATLAPPRASTRISKRGSRMARERLTALEQSLAEREGLPPAARALAEAGERLALQLLDVAPGQRAVGRRRARHIARRRSSPTRRRARSSSSSTR